MKRQKPMWLCWYEISIKALESFIRTMNKTR